MSNALNAAITYKSVGGFPLGTAVASILVSLSAQTPTNNTSQSLAPNSASAAFSGLNPDVYTPSAQAQDANGNPLGSAVSGAAVTVQGSQQTVALELPASITGTAA